MSLLFLSWVQLTTNFCVLSAFSVTTPALTLAGYVDIAVAFVAFAEGLQKNDFAESAAFAGAAATFFSLFVRDLAEVFFAFGGIFRGKTNIF